jgi:hypothetical protein
MEEDGFTEVHSLWPAVSGVGWYMCSLLVLAAYILVNLARPDLLSAGEGPQAGRWDGSEGRVLGFTTSGCVLLIDLTLVYMYHAGLLRSYTSACTATALSRLGLIAYGARYWLLGISTVYVVIGVYLAHTAVAQYFATHSTIGLRRQVTQLVDQGEDAKPESSTLGAPPYSTCANAAALPRCVGSALLGFGRSPFTVVTIVTLVFAAFIGGLGTAMRQDRYATIFPGDEVQVMENRLIPQSTFAVGALIIVLQVVLLEIGYKLYYRGQRGWTALGWWVVLLACLGFAGAAIGLWHELQSVYILTVGVFYPPAIAVTMALYGRWVRDDFQAWMGPSPFSCCRRGGRDSNGTGDVAIATV